MKIRAEEQKGLNLAHCSLHHHQLFFFGGSINSNNTRKMGRAAGVPDKLCLDIEEGADDRAAQLSADKNTNKIDSEQCC